MPSSYYAASRFVNKGEIKKKKRGITFQGARRSRSIGNSFLSLTVAGEEKSSKTRKRRKRESSSTATSARCVPGNQKNQETEEQGLTYSFPHFPRKGKREKGEGTKNPKDGYDLSLSFFSLVKEEKGQLQQKRKTYSYSFPRRTSVLMATR